MSTYKAYLSATTFLRVFTYKMAARINCHRYGTKLRHCHSMYKERFFTSMACCWFQFPVARPARSVSTRTLVTVPPSLYGPRSKSVSPVERVRRWPLTLPVNCCCCCCCCCCGNTIHKHPVNGPLSGTTRVSRTRKVKPIWILLKHETVSGSGIGWAICKSAPCSR